MHYVEYYSLKNYSGKAGQSSTAMPLKPSHDLSTNSTLERSFQGKRTWVSGTVNPRRVSMRIHSIADLHLSSCFIEEKKELLNYKLSL